MPSDAAMRPSRLGDCFTRNIRFQLMPEFGYSVLVDDGPIKAILCPHFDCNALLCPGDRLCRAIAR